MGAVVAATPVAGGPTVAIKFMLPRLADEARFVARFMREARATFRLASPHVPRVLEVGALETGAPYIVMEYLDGTDLRTLVREGGTLSARDAADYVLQACRALEEAHARGIVHRDLKPANLFLARVDGGPPIVKVLDFGVAKMESDPGAGERMEMTNTGAVLGSRLYMSPEQMRSPRDVDGRADIWALGVCLYYLATGTTPFAAETTEEVILKVMLHPPHPLRERAPAVPAEYEQVVSRCLEKAPAMRYATVKELSAALEPIARGEVGPRISLLPEDAQTLSETTPFRGATATSEGPWLRTDKHRAVRAAPSSSALMAAGGLVIGAAIAFAIVSARDDARIDARTSPMVSEAEAATAQAGPAASSAPSEPAAPAPPPSAASASSALAKPGAAARAAPSAAPSAAPVAPKPPASAQPAAEAANARAKPKPAAAPKPASSGPPDSPW